MEMTLALAAWLLIAIVAMVVLSWFVARHAFPIPDPRAPAPDPLCLNPPTPTWRKP